MRLQPAWIAASLVALGLGLDQAIGQLSSGETVEEACPTAFIYENPVCVNNGTLHIGDRSEGEKSCSYCDCEDGWEGVDCGRCSSVSVCPALTINGTLVPASNCSSSSLVPTEEEAGLEGGKIFSCSCGGGGDAFTEAICILQPDTWVEFAVDGPGTAASPAVISFIEFAGMETMLQERFPGEHDYFYPVIFEGEATGCTITRGNCLAVEDTDIGEQECVLFDCEDIQGSCPPVGYEVCDGFPNCFNEDGEEYQVHTCTAAPAAGKTLTISCQVEQVDGKFICWYQQPGEFAPLSVTCSVGSCLYEANTTVVQVETTVIEEAPLDISEQTMILVAAALGLAILFCLFALATDWGSARRDSRSCCFSKKVKGEEQPPKAVRAMASSGPAAAVGSRNGSNVSAFSVSGAPPTPVMVPAVLAWKNLDYSVTVKARGGGSGSGSGNSGSAGGSSGGGGGSGTGGGGGAFSFLPSACRHSELSVLSRVSGFAGPTAAAAYTAGAAESTTVPSTMTGILGPSGAGKSSLLDILAGRKRSGDGRAAGEISLTVGGNGGNGGNSSPKEIQRVAGYVPQEDVLPGTLTCYEHLMFHARLRMPRSATHGERRAQALRVLSELGLSRVADSRIGDARKRGLSGGEKRRLSIAAELIGRPPLLFLDEPTTGLDAATALRVMVLLKGVASRGTTILCSLHQPRPRVLDLLDNVMLLAHGEVAYFGPPRDAEAYFSSVGRPFPPEQPHPADAMLTLCCRDDGSALPSLFERCDAVENGVYSGGGGGGGEEGGKGNGAIDGPGTDVESGRTSRPREVSSRQNFSGASGDVEAAAAPAGAGGQEKGGGDGNNGGESGSGLRRWVRSGSREGGQATGVKCPPRAGFLVQTEALSKRLLLRAVRHPLLLILHFGGSLAMAVCLGTIFQGKLEFTLGGAQSRLGVLYFLLLYLSLLSLTSLPVWREDRRLFLSESMGGAYGHLAYFLSVALADVLLVRVVPPLAFAVVAYPVMGLNDFPDGKWTLMWFSVILVLANVAVALAAMGVGAFGLPLDLSNFLGGSMVLVFSLFSRFLLNGSRIPEDWEWLSNVTPLGYAYESLLINEFNDPLGERPYTIGAEKCSPELPIIKPLGATILKTFDFDPSLNTMHDNVGALALIALVFGALSFLLFYIFTRTSPLMLRKPGKHRRSSSRPPSSNYGNPTDENNGGASPSVHAPLPEGTSKSTDDSAAPYSGGPTHPSSGGDAISPPTGTTNVGDSSGAGGTAPNSEPILLSWQDLGFSVPMASRGPCGTGGCGSKQQPQNDDGRLAILKDVSGFAGPTTADADIAPVLAAAADSAAVRAWSGSVTAIMGPSGAGKTTLLNVLAGRHHLGKGRKKCGSSGVDGGGGGGRVTGAVRINGREASAAEVRGVSGYVTQEDVLPETLTCFEHLMFHAELRMWAPVASSAPALGRRSVSRGDRKQRVLEVLRDLRLEGVRDSRIGGGLSRGISGGEKRRLSIATELLTCPALLFLDEPTTGLDSSTALTTMQLLSNLAASRGTTVLCSLHQPRPQVFNSLDRVLLVSRGAVSFFGAPSNTGLYFASMGRPLGRGSGSEEEGGTAAGTRVGGVGTADAMLDIIGDAEMAVDGEKGGNNRESAELVVMPDQELLAKVRSAEAAAPPPLGRKVVAWTPPVTTQLCALTGRALRDVARDPYLAALHLILTPLVGLLVGSLFGDLRRFNEETAGIQGRLGALFFFLLLLAFLCLTSLASWVRQMALFRHERESGAYGAPAHLVTSFLADALVCRVLPPILLAVTVRPLAGLRYGSLPGLIVALVIFNVVVAAVLAACGAGAKTPQEALAMGCLFVLFSALLSGYLVARDDLPVVWGALVWASPFAHGFEALTINEFSEYGAVFRLSTVISNYTTLSDYLTGDNILGCFGFDPDRYGTDLEYLIIIGAVGLLLAYVLLKRA